MRVIVVHGMFCHGDHTQALVGGLRRAGIKATSFELRGRHRGFGTLRDHVDIVGSQVDQLTDYGEDVGLVGHSMGGLVCLLAAAARADTPCLRRLALLGAAPPAGVNGFTWANLQLFLPAIFGRGATLPSYERYVSLFMNRQDTALRRSVYELLVPDSRRLIRSIAVPALSRSHPGPLRFSTSPCFQTLVLAGAGDRSTPPRVQRAIAARIPGARYLLLNTPDHYGFIAGEGSTETLDVLKLFLAG